MTLIYKTYYTPQLRQYCWDFIEKYTLVRNSVLLFLIFLIIVNFSTFKTRLNEKPISGPDFFLDMFLVRSFKIFRI